MRRIALWGFPIVCVCAPAEGGNSQAEPIPDTQDAATDATPLLHKAVRLDGILSGSPAPLPRDIEIRRHYCNHQGDRGAAAVVTGEAVYANTGGSAIVAPGVNRRIADDLMTVAIGGCQMPEAWLSAYEILVGVKFSEGGGDPYTVHFGLWDACPGGNPPGQPILGTDGSITLDDDGALHLITMDLEGSGVSLDSSFWIGVKFQGNADAGWVVGTPADMGYTQDVYDYPHPSLRCSARFGGTNLYAGFYAKVYCGGEVEVEFPAYLNPELDGIHLQDEGTAGLWLADDVELIVDDCVLTSYQVGVRGGVGTYRLDVELWDSLGPQHAIEGTQGVFQGIGDGSNELAHFTFENGVPLSTSSLWAAMKCNRNFTGPIIAEEATLGFSADLMAICYSANDCVTISGGGAPQASVNATINCLGAPPVGACCEVVGSGWACRETSELSCMGPGARWVEGEPCDPDPFDPPCGGFACCLPEPFPRGSCENLDEGYCSDLGGVWDGQRLCGFAGQGCGWFVCRETDGGCDAEHDAVGCDEMSCCSGVCDVDHWCCEQYWDAVCVREAKDICCPAAEVAWLAPAGGVVDARQPHPVDDPEAAQGIDEIQAAASSGASTWCWTLCETDPGESPNSIASVAEITDGVYAITLDRPITPGAVTTISYYGDEGSTGTGRFTSHPGNVDGDGEAGPADIAALIDHLDGVDPLPWGLYGCDVDHSGDCGPGDVLRVIDLLNGAGEFVPWNGTELPLERNICP